MMDDVQLRLTGHVLDWIDGEISGGSQLGINQSYLSFLQKQDNNLDTIDPGRGLGRYPGGHVTVRDATAHLANHGRTIRLPNGTFADIRAIVQKASYIDQNEYHYDLNRIYSISGASSNKLNGRYFDVFWFDGGIASRLQLSQDWHPSIVEEIAKQFIGTLSSPIPLNRFSYARPKYNSHWNLSNQSKSIWYPLTNNIVIENIMKQPNNNAQSGGIPQINQSFLSAGVPKNTSIKNLSKSIKTKDPQYGISMKRPWSVESHDYAIRNDNGHAHPAVYLINPSSGKHFVFKRIAPPNDQPTLDRTRPAKYYYRGRGYRKPGLPGWNGPYITVASLVHLEANGGLYCISIGDDLKDNALNTPPSFTYNDGEDTGKQNHHLDGAVVVIRGNRNRVRINIYESMVLPLFNYRMISFLQLQGSGNFIELVFYGKLMIGQGTFNLVSSGDIPIDYNSWIPTGAPGGSGANQIVVRSGYGLSPNEHLRRLNQSINQYGDPVGMMNPANYVGSDPGLKVYSYTNRGDNTSGLNDASEPPQWGVIPA